MVVLGLVAGGRAWLGTRSSRAQRPPKGGGGGVLS